MKQFKEQVREEIRKECYLDFCANLAVLCDNIKIIKDDLVDDESVLASFQLGRISEFLCTTIESYAFREDDEDEE